MKTKTLSPELLHKMGACWRAANYLSVGQIYLYDNPLLKRPLTLADVKHMLLGHWGTTPGQNFIYVHLNRVIKKYDLGMIYVSGPGHGGPAVVGNTYLEGTYSEIYPNISRDEAGLRKLFIQFSFPGGIPSHASPECPGSIHEGGELGYSLSHSFGAVLDNPDLIVACVVGDGEAETRPLATAWHSNKFLNPATDGAVLPILHLNGYKISNPTVLARITREELEQLLRGYGWTPYFVEGHDPRLMHEAMATALDTAVEQIKKIQQDARVHGKISRPRWPMIVLNSPKGWTGPKMVDGLQVEGTFRAHQVPLSDPATHPEHLKLLEDWLKSYRPEELFDEQGRLKPEIAELAPKGERRMGANPRANGGILLRDLRMPDFRAYAADVPLPGAHGIGDTHVLGRFLRDVTKLNSDQRNFRVFGPDETLSNGLEALFEVSKRQWDAATVPNDGFLAPTGRVMGMLSEHQSEGWLEGYLLTGRHGFFNCYEAFIHIIDSMFNQHAKWLKVTPDLPCRRKIASLNYLLASHVWRQDHNGFTHQDPGFIDHVVNKKAEVVRVYVPTDANCLLSVMDHCLRSRHYINVVIAGKHPAPQWLTMDAALKHCTEGIGIWQWASNDQGVPPDVVMACCGDVPTLETLAAVSLMRGHLPDLKIRVINVVDLMKLQPQTEHPHGLSDMDFDELFTKNKPVISAFHACPWLIHRLTYRRTNHDNMHVRGYKEEGTITTPFDPVHKRTAATIKGAGRKAVFVAKGAPQVILEMSVNAGEITPAVEKAINEFAARGFRSLGVALADEVGKWLLVGVLALFDPPREQANATIASARQMGVSIKMVTGDQLATGQETAKELGMGTNILDASSLGDEKRQDTAQSAKAIEKADGFAQVFPEHKFHIFVGMTGDGVNDAPALKQADCGIAVSGATDAARAAGSIVLLAPGLSVIIDAIKESRRIVQRMNSYAIYRIAETLRVLLFIVLSILIFNFYPVTAVMIVMLAVLNDGAILSIAYDNVHKPEAWNMHLVLGIATVLGIVGPIAAFGLFYLGDRVFHLGQLQLQTLMYLLLSVAGHLTIFLTRTRGPFWSIRPARISWVAVLGTQTLATLIAVYGLFMTPLGWGRAAFVWGYALVWALVSDRVKLLGYRIFDPTKPPLLARKPFDLTPQRYPGL